MPNFKCLRVKTLTLPFENGGVSFKWLAKSPKFRLVLAEFNETEFFIQIAQNAKNEFVIKGEKHSKPQQIGYLQKALLVFKEAFCEGVINEALALKNTRLMSQSAYLARNLDELKAKIPHFKATFLEIGFGSGRHLLYLARQNPEFLALGVEIYLPALEQVAKLAQKDGLNNVFLINCDARLLLNALDSSTLTRIFLHFPVPWDKQESRRVVSADFAREILRVLAENGRFELRTDSKEYFEFTREIFAKFGVKIKVAKNENFGIVSKYETRWKKQKKDIFDLVVFKQSAEKSGLSSFEGFDDFGDFNNGNLHLNSSFGDFESKNLGLNSSKNLALNSSENLALNSWDEILRDLNFDKNALKLLSQGFENVKFKGEDFFLSLENLYFINETNSLLKAAFGAFDKSEHAFLLLNQNSKFLFKQPFLTQQNFNALKKISEILTGI